jgi:hypothetical protein
MTNIFLAAQVDIPAPPDLRPSELDSLDEFTVDTISKLNQTLGLVKPDYSSNLEKRGPAFTERWLTKDNFQHQSGSIFTLWLSSQIGWAQQNITKYAKDVRYTISTSNRKSVGPHSDLTRSYTLIYVLEPGGNDTRTVFYQERSHNQLEHPLGVTINDYSLLDVIGNFKLPVNQWSLLNAQVIHSIEGLTGHRESVQIGLDIFPDDLKLINPVYINA